MKCDYCDGILDDITNAKYRCGNIHYGLICDNCNHIAEEVVKFFGITFGKWDMKLLMAMYMKTGSLDILGAELDLIWLGLQAAFCCYDYDYNDCVDILYKDRYKDK